MANTELRKYDWPERIIVWLLTFAFLAAAGAKLAHVPDVVDVFHRFGLPEWFMVVTAIVEITGALALHLRRGRLALIGPALLAATMIVGAGFHLMIDTPPQAAPAITLALLALVVLFFRRPMRGAHA